MKLSERIKEARTQKGLIQADLAEKIGVSRVTIINWEKGVTTPNRNEIDQLSEVLGVDLTKFFLQETQNAEVEAPVEPALVDKMIKAYQSTIDSKQQEIESKEKEILRLVDDKKWMREVITDLTRGLGARQEAG